MTKGAYPEALQRVVAALSRWPGIGEKSAARLALYLLRAPQGEVLELAEAVTGLKEKVRLCRRCFAFADQELCPLCANSSRQTGVLMVVADPGIFWPLKKWAGTRAATTSWAGCSRPWMGWGLMICGSGTPGARQTEGIQEVILALNPSLEGETTTTYLSQEVKPLGVKVSRIAYGLPMGGDIKYADRDTLREALNYRVET
jgi:recombination protein RecR